MSSSTLRGLSSITAVALLGKPKPIVLRTIELEAQLYLGGDAVSHLFGVLKFYNQNNITFDSAKPGLYLIEASFVQIPEQTGVVPYSANGYDFCGDLQWVMPLGQLALPNFRPYVHIAGMASNCNNAVGTWMVNIEPYVSATIKPEPGVNPAPSRPRAPFFCHHPEPVGQAKKRPTPYNNRFVAVHGFITDVLYKPDSDTIIAAFKITVDNLEFLGAEPTSSSSPSGSVVLNALDSPENGSATTPTFGKMKGKGKAVAKVPHMPETPTPAASSSKRAREDDEHREQPPRGRKQGPTSSGA